MLFQAEITIAVGQTEANPQIMRMPIAKGIITKFMVRPRPGHGAVAHLVILHHEHQIAPSVQRQIEAPGAALTLHGDTFPIDWEDYYECYQPPFELKLVGWNTSTRYSHTFDVFVAVLPRKAILAYQIVDALIGAFGMLSPKRIFTGSS